MPTDIVARVVARYKQADMEFAPDPLTYKAFMSEFHQGIKSGDEKATSLKGVSEGGGIQGEIAVSEDKIAVAAQELLELSRRLDSFASRGNMAVNEHRLVPKMSGILSTLFYQMGFVRGLKKSV